MPKSSKRGFDVKVHVTPEHVGAFELISNAENRSKLIMQLAALGYHAYQASKNGAPMRTQTIDEPFVDVSFDDDDQGFG